VIHFLGLRGGMIVGRFKQRYKSYLLTVSSTDAITTVASTTTNTTDTHTNDNVQLSTTLNSNNINILTRNGGGRPSGITQDHIDNMQECIISAKHEITQLYKEAIMKSKARGQKNTKRPLSKNT
jgi:hypothetical protein